MTLRLLTALHGYLGALSLAALLHPALMLRSGSPLRGRRRKLLLVATGGLTLTTLGGLLLYPSYRGAPKVTLVHADLSAALLFESKEHLAFTVLCLALAGTFSALSKQEPIRRAGGRLILAAVALGVLVACIGVYTARLAPL